MVKIKIQAMPAEPRWVSTRLIRSQCIRKPVVIRKQVVTRNPVVTRNLAVIRQLSQAIHRRNQAIRPLSQAMDTRRLNLATRRSLATPLSPAIRHHSS